MRTSDAVGTLLKIARGQGYVKGMKEGFCWGVIVSAPIIVLLTLMTLGVI